MATTSAVSLITLAVSKRDEASYSKTLLLNTERILDSVLNSSGKAEFYYDQEGYDLKFPAVKYTCSTLTERNLLWAINRADPNQPRFKVHCMRERKSGHAEVVRDKMITISTSQVLLGYDKADGLSCYLWIKRGNQAVRLELSHLIADLVRAASKSASLSRSPMS